MDKSECYNTLLRKLKNIETPNCVAECCDVTCKNKNHNNTCDDYLKDILDAMEESCECLPAIGNNAKKKKNSNIIGWNQFVRSARDTAYFWNSVWVSANKPLNTELHTIMKKTKNAYHIQIRKVKRAEKRIKSDKLLANCANGNLNLFNDIRNMRKTNHKVANKIDDTSVNIVRKIRCSSFAVEQFLFQ